MRLLVLAVGFLLLPLSVLAQAAGDRDYCLALADTYTRYIGHDIAQNHRLVGRGSLDAQIAVGKCQQGRDIPWAINILEQQLRNGGFTLPRRR